MSQYVIAREGVTPVAGDVLLALTAQTDEAAKINEVFCTGEGVASAVNRMTVRRSSSNGTTPSTQTPAKMSPTSQATIIAGATTFTGQPSTAAAPALWTAALNVFGGIARWAASVGQEMYIEGGTAGNNEVSLESSSGTGVLSCQIVFEEV